MCAEAEKVRITVFTPAYNRGYIIENLYDSLKKQTFRDFEWLVVDDGSTDDTAQRFEKILRENRDFSVRYVKTENGGKHRAINRGVQEAAGELFFIVDSDDYLTENALSMIDSAEKSIPGDQASRFAGVCGTRCTPDGRIIGTVPGRSPLDIRTLDREKNGIFGDKAEVIYTDIMRKYPFPTFEGEKFLTECVVWDRISADGLLLRFIPEPMIVCQYREDGLTHNLEKLNQKNPRGCGLFYAQRVRLGVLRGMEKRQIYLDYYYQQREQLSMKTMAEYLQCSPAVFRMTVLAMRIYQKFHDR